MLLQQLFAYCTILLYVQMLLQQLFAYRTIGGAYPCTAHSLDFHRQALILMNAMHQNASCHGNPIAIIQELVHPRKST